MNKREAIAYGQITLETMLHYSYAGELNIENFGIQMREVIKIYPRNIVLDIAKSKLYAEKKLKQLKAGGSIGK